MNFFIYRVPKELLDLRVCKCLTYRIRMAKPSWFVAKTPFPLYVSSAASALALGLFFQPCSLPQCLPAHRKGGERWEESRKEVGKLLQTTPVSSCPSTWTYVATGSRQCTGRNPFLQPSQPPLHLLFYLYLLYPFLLLFIPRTKNDRKGHSFFSPCSSLSKFDQWNVYPPCE